MSPAIKRSSAACEVEILVRAIKAKLTKVRKCYLWRQVHVGIIVEEQGGRFHVVLLGRYVQGW